MYQINMYIETSIRGVKKTIGWYGYLLEWLDRAGTPHTVFHFQYEIGVTPNMLFLSAFCAALDRLTKDSEITVFTDSLYLREGYTRYLPVWKENGWKTAHGDAIKNIKFWQQIAEKTKRHTIIYNPDSRHGYKNWMLREIQERKEKKCSLN